MSQPSSTPLDELVERTAEVVIRMVQPRSGSDPKPAVKRVLYRVMAEACELERQTEPSHMVYQVKAVSKESVIEVLRALDYAPIHLTPGADGRYIWRWMESEGTAPSFLAALRDVLRVAVVGVLPNPAPEEEHP